MSPLPIMTGAQPVQYMDDDCLTAKAIEQQTMSTVEALAANTQAVTRLADIMQKRLDLEIAEAKKEKKEPPKKSKGKVLRDADGYITGWTDEEVN